MKAIATPVGPIVTLPPEDPLTLPVPWVAGQSVDVDVECPTCLGHRRNAWATGVCSSHPDGLGTVSVPHVVTAVARIVTTNEHGDILVLPNIDSRRQTLYVGDRWAFVDLPDAQPGGVALVVAPAGDPPSTNEVAR